MRVHYVCIHGNCIKLSQFLSGRAKNKPKTKNQKQKKMKNKQKKKMRHKYIAFIRLIYVIYALPFLFFIFLEISETNLRSLVRAWHLDNLNNLIQLRNRIVNVICFIFRRIYLRVWFPFYFMLCYEMVLLALGSVRLCVVE